MKQHLWMKAKSSPSAFAANMGAPMPRKARHAPSGMGGKMKMGKSKKKYK